MATSVQMQSTVDRSSRRQFCRALAIAAFAAASDSVAKLQAAPINDFEIGKQIFKSLKWNMVKLKGSTLHKFQTLKRLGYEGVELDSPEGIDAAEARSASEATGLIIEGIVNSTHWTIRHSDPNPGIRKQALENMQTAIRYADSVGAKSVLLVPGKVADPREENHGQVWERSIEEIKKLIPLAQQLKVQILIENVGNGFCESPELFAEYIDAIGSEWAAIHFDIGNHIRVSPPANWIRILGHRIKKLDVKDRTQQNESTLIGEGDAEWPEVRKALKEIGYRGWAAAEVPGGGEKELAAVLQRMNQVLGPSNGNPASVFLND